jgi:lipopolysaccharide/colanic/teichoic acid biosynthesis glycosyltransferase
MGQRFFEVNESIVRHSFALATEKALRDAKPHRDFLRSLGEPVLGILMLVVMAPLFVFCAVLVKLTSRGPVFFYQDRVGKDGDVFRIVKFRTMMTGAERQTGPVLSFKGDPRVTKMGRFLRNTHLDELPQLFNIISGEMSFIGPRPERPEFVNDYNKEIYLYRLRERVKPGVTGLAQVCCSYDATAEEKLEFDIGYLKHVNSIKMNLTILIFTLKKVLSVRFN